jgi:hypothetical protein
MTLSFTRVLLALALAAGAHATTINFTTNAASGSCFLNTFDNAGSGCQATGVNPSAALTFTNLQGDSASILWTGVTNSIGFGSGPIQNVNYGSFTVTYTSNDGNFAPVSIPQLSFLMIVKEFFPATVFYQPMLANLTGASSGPGSVGPGTADLQASFSPATVTNGVDTTFFVAPAVQVLNGPGASSGQTNIVGQVQNTATPEPSTWLLLGMALPFVIRYARRA